MEFWIIQLNKGQPSDNEHTLSEWFCWYSCELVFTAKQLGFGEAIRLSWPAGFAATVPADSTDMWGLASLAPDVNRTVT